MKIGICDDDENQIVLLKNHIKKWARNKAIKVEMAEFISGENFLLEGDSVVNFDLMFLDIHMKNISGIELATIIRKMDKELAIVFVTGFSDYVFQGYDVGALNYLVKPVTEEKCHGCLDRVYDKIIGQGRDYLLIQAGGAVQKCLYNDIYYFESFSHSIVVHMDHENMVFWKRTSDLEQELPNHWFIRVHRSYIVNLQHVVSVEGAKLKLDNGKEIPVSRYRLRETSNAFIRYYS